MGSSSIPLLLQRKNYCFQRERERERGEGGGGGEREGVEGERHEIMDTNNSGCYKQDSLETKGEQPNSQLRRNEQ